MIFSLLLLLTFKVIFWKKIHTDQMLNTQCDEIISKGDLKKNSATLDSASAVSLQLAYQYGSSLNRYIFCENAAELHFGQNDTLARDTLAKVSRPKCLWPKCHSGQSVIQPYIITTT